MMKKIKPILWTVTLTVIGLTVAGLTVAAQAKSPMVSGTVDISIRKGTIAGDFVLTDLPPIRNYVIRLNSGLNIHYFKDVKRSSLPLYYDMDTKDSILSDETKAYFLHENGGNPARYIPDELEVKYLGLYPVIKDSASGYMGQDWRGNIAFNGYSIRAEGLQGDWYPELYDMDMRKLYNEVRYNITVTCKDCSVLFLNGSSPVKAKKATFVSNDPHEMSIYCGTFKTAEQNGVWLLNSDMKKEDEQKLFSRANADEAYYAKQMDIPFNGTLTFVQTDPVADPKRWGFSFFTAPTTINVASGPWGLNAMFDANNGGKNRKGMAHELAHYYFGTLVEPYGNFGFVIEEGMAEYMALKLTRSMDGEDVFRSLLQEKVESLKYLHNYKSFDQVKTEDDYGNREYYLYYYAPLLLTAIEKEVGEKTMWEWLSAMAKSRSTHADYNFFAESFKRAVTDPALQQKVLTKYFQSPDALQNAKDELGLN